jgi:hypothetical protein
MVSEQHVNVFRRLDRSAEGAEWRDLLSTIDRHLVERRPLHFASLRSAPVEAPG